MPSGSQSTNAPLNFGPSEQTTAQRQHIADRAIAVLNETGELIRPELLTLYKKYVAGQADLYAISVLVGEHARQRLLELVATT